jgi:hypothetical protein
MEPKLKSPFDDGEMHRLFREMRERVTDVLVDFTDQVMFRIKLAAEAEGGEGPSIETLVTENMIEAANMVVASTKLASPETKQALRQHESEEDEEKRDDD